MRTLKIIMISIFVAASVGFVSWKGLSPSEAKIDLEDILENEKIDSRDMIRIEDKGYMIASWYGPNFHGKYTANGEIYDQMAYTAAHKYLPFGTMLKLTNPRNGKSILVRINDRGPYIKGRNLDLSKGAAIALGTFKRGVMKVKVEQVKVNDSLSPV